MLEGPAVYTSSGLVIDAATGAYVQQFGAQGAVGVSTASDRILFLDDGQQLRIGDPSTDELAVFRLSTGDPVASLALPIWRGDARFLAFGDNGLLYRSLGRLFVLRANQF